jgi:uncharacterized protein involved in exopolysaccharide biosynthesis
MPDSSNVLDVKPVADWSPASMRSAGPPDQDTDGVSLVSIGVAILERRKLVVVLPFVLAVLVLLMTLLSQRTYTSAAVFLPQADQGGSARLSGLAAQIGLPFLGGPANQTGALYTRLVTMRPIASNLVDSQYTVTVDGRPVTRRLSDVFGLEAETASGLREKTIARVQKQLNATVDPETQLIQLSATSPDPTVSQRMADLALRLLMATNARTKRDIASNEARFAAERLREARDELEKAESAHEAFLLANRVYQNDPRLVSQEQRLERNIQIAQQVYTTLAFAAEQARMDAERTAPSLTVIQAPEVPIIPNSRGTVVKTLGAGLFGVILACGIAVALMLLRSGSGASPDTERFHELVGETRADLGRLLWWRRRSRTPAL